MAAYTEARKRANEKWNAENLERIVLNTPKGTKDIWKDYATKTDMSLTRFIREAVEEKARREGLVLVDDVQAEN